VTLRHLTTEGREQITEALYELDGQPSCARLFGHLSEAEVAEKLAQFRASGRR
jgi:DNA-binding MarR family transcriptional regulator